MHRHYDPSSIASAPRPRGGVVKKGVLGSAVLVLLFLRPAMPISASFSEVYFPTTTTNGCNAELADTILTERGWTKAFEENFNTLDTSTWDIWESGAWNNELQCYTKSTDNLRVTNGVLEIRAKKEQPAISCEAYPGAGTQRSFDYSSGRIESIDPFSFSADSATPTVRFYARMKLPAGAGMWAAFWTLGHDWPHNGEIDIVEARGQDPQNYQTNYIYGSGDVNEVGQAAANNIATSGDLTSCYHIYAVEWKETTLKFFLDGKQVAMNTALRQPGRFIPNLFGKEHYITLNLAVGGNFFNPPVTQITTGTLYVDWVKVFTSPEP